MRIFLNLRKNNKKKLFKNNNDENFSLFSEKKWKKTEDVDKKSPFGKLKASAKKRKNEWGEMFCAKKTTIVHFEFLCTAFLLSFF